MDQTSTIAKNYRMKLLPLYTSPHVSRADPCNDVSETLGAGLTTNLDAHFQQQPGTCVAKRNLEPSGRVIFKRSNRA